MAPKGLFDVKVHGDDLSLKRAVKEGTGGAGVDVIIPCTPQVRLDGSVFDLLAPRGRLCVFSGPNREDSPLPVDLRDMHYRELTVVGSYGNSSRNCRDAVELLRSGPDLSWMMTGRFALDQVEKAFDHASSRQGMKAVVTF